MILKTLAAFIAVVLVLIGIVWMQLRAPTPVGVPLQHGVVANVTIVEPGHTPRDRQTLIVRDGVIAEIRDALAEELQGPERFVLPGLIDMHVHQPLTLGGLPDYLALLYLRHGVTSVRYTGYSSTGAALDLHRARVAAGVIPGPRIFSCGPIIDGEPPFWETSIVLTDPAQAEPAVAGLAAHKVDCIKVYSNLERDVLRAVADAAAQRGLTVVGHVPRTVPLEDSGIDDVQHLIGVSGRRVGADDINPMVDGWDARQARDIARANFRDAATASFLGRSVASAYVDSIGWVEDSGDAGGYAGRLRSRPRGCCRASQARCSNPCRDGQREPVCRSGCGAASGNCAACRSWTRQ